jgi:hypothetical protein
VIVDVHHPTDRLAQFQVLYRCRKAIADRGVTLAFHPDTAPDPNSDKPLVAHHCYVVKSPRLARRCIVIEKSDAAELLDHYYPERTSVRAIVKHSMLRHGLLRCAPLRLYMERIGWPRQERRARLTRSALGKVHVGLHFGQYDCLQPWVEREPDIDAERPIDVSFVGSAHYSKDAMNAHRRSCAKAVSSLPSPLSTLAHVGVGVPRDAYVDLAYRTKIVVSPWGAGQACYRDYEAMLGGAVLVKPESDDLRAGCGLYDNGKTYFACRPDFSNLPQVVTSILDAWRSLHKMRASNRDVAAREWQPGFVADWFVDLLRKRLIGE